MQTVNGNEILLLKETCKVVLEIANFFTGDDPRAQKARQKLENKHKNSAKGKDCAAWYANLSVDLGTLNETLQHFPDTWSDGQGPGISAACQLLNTIQDQFLVKDHLVREDNSEDEDDEVPEPESPFALLRSFFHNLKAELGSEPNDEDETEKTNWFCKMTKFDNPRSKSRDSLIRAVKECEAALKPHAQPRPVDISFSPHKPADLEWAEVGEAFQFVEKLYETLEYWDCNCFHGTSHRDAKFSFDLGSTRTHQSVAGTIYYPTVKYDKCVWKSAHMQFQEHSDSPTTVLKPPPLPTTRRHSQGGAGHVHPHNRRKSMSDLCGMLETISLKGEGLVKLAAGKPKLYDAPEDAMVVPSPAMGSEDALVDCYNLPHPQALLRMSFKHRMSLALFLAYAYLHLGGGLWWPYDKKPNLHSLKDPNEETPPSRLIFFTPSFPPSSSRDQSGNEDDPPFVLKMANAQMPSLPAFGKLLLELYLGQSVAWEDLDKRLNKARGDLFAKELLQAVSTCLGMYSDKTFTDGGTIRDKETLRLHFVKEVILPIQYVLRVGYQLKVQDIFCASETGGVVEVKERPVKRLKHHSPVRVEGPESVPSDFCLHDGEDGMEELADTRAKSADDYMEELQRCARTLILDQRTDPSTTKPVRIAILDTGAHIPSEQIEHVYDDRVKECRTWLRSPDDEGETQPRTSSDRDGHGTHGTSVLLQATQDTDIEVYVAQIFGKRSEKVKQDCIVDDPTIRRIANSIRFAVDYWNVDVISMSFGFPQPVPEIEKAIEHARTRNVLMLAAASNCGGNRSRSWPARIDDVMCIYATDGHGNKYAKNPTPADHEDNFAVLGDSVRACWPPANGKKEVRLVRKSGTSTATPICAAIAGLVITVLRRHEDGYIQGLGLKEDASRAKRMWYQRQLVGLGKASGMSKIFRLMADKGGTRDGYQYVAPWKVFDESNQSRTTILENILRCIDA